MSYLIELENRYNSEITTCCMECGSIDIVNDPKIGETICKKCGLVIEDHSVNEGPEWRAYTPEERERKSRIGDPISFSFPDKGLSTSMADISYDIHGRSLSFQAKMKLRRLRKWHRRSRVRASRDRNLTKAMAQLRSLSESLKIPKHVKEKTALIYRKALKKNLIQGRSIAGIIAASLYAAIRLTKTPRSLRKVAEVSLADKKEVARSYRLLVKELEIHVPASDPMTFLSKMENAMSVSGKTQGLTARIIREASRRLVSAGKDPLCLAAAVLYLSCRMTGERRTQKEIADEAGVTEVSVRNLYRVLKNNLDLEKLNNWAN